MRRLVIASNRGPVSWRRADDGSWSARRGAGGLIVALGGALQANPGTWVSVAMDEGDREVAAGHEGAFDVDTGEGQFTVRLVDAGAAYERYYGVVANQLLWFTLHQLWAEPYEPSGLGWREAFDDYLHVNRLVADAVVQEAGDGVVEVHVQDYHLLVAPRLIRRARPDARMCVYLHTPWVGPDYLRRLPDPVAEALRDGLAAADLVGTSSPRWAEHVRAFLGDRVRTTVASFTLGVQAEGLAAVLASPAAQRARADIRAWCGDRRLVVRADRTDLSKNIIRGFQAFRRLLEEEPDRARDTAMLALLNPSRQAVPAYGDYLERCVAEAEALRADVGGEAVRLEVGQDFPTVVAAHASYDVLLTNPVLDGTNLVAKEGPVLNERDGVLVLSRDAGAATVMHDALLINPYDVEATAAALSEALAMGAEERARRAAGLRQSALEGGPAAWLAAQRAHLA